MLSPLLINLQAKKVGGSILVHRKKVTRKRFEGGEKEESNKKKKPLREKTLRST